MLAGLGDLEGRFDFFGGGFFISTSPSPSPLSDEEVSESEEDELLEELSLASVGAFSSTALLATTGDVCVAVSSSEPESEEDEEDEEKACLLFLFLFRFLDGCPLVAGIKWSLN